MPILKDTLDHPLDHDPQIRTVSRIPMESERIDVTLEQVEAYFGQLRDSISGVPCHPAFNMDEMGHQPWAGRVRVKRRLPADYLSDQVYITTSVTAKRIVPPDCIAAGGSYLKPCATIRRRAHNDGIPLFGWTQDKLFVHSQSKSYDGTDIFNDCFKDTFFPALEERRPKWNYGGLGLLVLENCTAHRGGFLDQACQARLCPFFCRHTPRINYKLLSFVPSERRKRFFDSISLRRA
jgi:hypothetical protein